MFGKVFDQFRSKISFNSAAKKDHPPTLAQAPTRNITDKPNKFNIRKLLLKHFRSEKGGKKSGDASAKNPCIFDLTAEGLIPMTTAEGDRPTVDALTEVEVYPVTESDTSVTLVEPDLEADVDATTTIDGNHRQVMFRFRNDLPYRLFFRQVDKHKSVSVSEEEAVEPGQDRIVAGAEDSIMSLHFFYLNEKWVMERSLGQVFGSKYISNFGSSESGEVLRLINNWTFEEETRLHHLNLYSRFCVMKNDTGCDLVYLQRSARSADFPGRLVKTFHPKGKKDEPILLNADMEFLFMAEANNNDNQLNWTYVPLDGINGTFRINLVTNGNLHRIISDLTFACHTSSSIIFTK